MYVCTCLTQESPNASARSSTAGGRTPGTRAVGSSNLSPKLKSARRWVAAVAQFAAPPAQFGMGKSYPGFSPTGPGLVTVDELRARDLLRNGLIEDYD